MERSDFLTEEIWGTLSKGRQAGLSLRYNIYYE